MLPVEPGFRPGKQGHPPTVPPRTTPPVQAGSHGFVTVSNALLRRSHGHHGRWRLKVSGHVRSDRAVYRAIIKVRRGGSWQRIGARRIGELFRVSVDPRIPAFHSARVTKVRVVVKGVGSSRAVSASVAGR